jgi:RNA polymerase sigma-70 factor (ECF subfamily)
MHGTLTMETSDTMTIRETARDAPGERLGDLFDRHHRDLYRLALRMLSDPEEARDLVQDAFLRAARRPSRLPVDEEGGRKWLIRVAVNLCRDRYRRRGVRSRFRARHDADVLFPSASAAPSPEAAAVARGAVGKALASLEPRRRAVVILHELEERSTAEVADLLGIAIVTVRWHLSRARRDLATLLAPQLREENGS